MRAKFNLQLFVMCLMLASASFGQTFSEDSFTTPIANIRGILEAVGGGLVVLAILWGLYKYIMGDRDSLKRVAGVVVVGIVIFAIGPALEFITGNAAFNQ